MHDYANESITLQAAVAVSDADLRVIPHEKMRDWLLQLAVWKFNAPPPVAREL